MDILTSTGTMHIAHSVLSLVPTGVLTAALQNVIKAALYCIPSPAWFPGGKFPRLRGRHTMPVPSLRLMQRMAQLVWKGGSDEEVRLLVEAALEQCKYAGAPWSWFALDVPLLLTRCRSEFVFSLLVFFTTQYGGPEQYTAAILPMLINAVKGIAAVTDGRDQHHFRAALLWVLDHPNDTLSALRMEYRVACVAALPLPDRKMYAAELWETAQSWTATARGGVLFLANCAGLLPHIFPHINHKIDFEHEAVWNWTVRHLQPAQTRSMSRYILKGTLPRRMYDTIKHWMALLPPGIGASADAEPDVCCICMEKLSDASAVQTARCSHAFHAACLYKWAVKKNECPICRTPLRDRAAAASTPTQAAAAVEPHDDSPMSIFQQFLGILESSNGIGVGNRSRNSNTIVDYLEPTSFQRYFHPLLDDGDVLDEEAFQTYLTIRFVY